MYTILVFALCYRTPLTESAPTLAEAEARARFLLRGPWAFAESAEVYAPGAVGSGKPIMTICQLEA